MTDSEFCDDCQRCEEDIKAISWCRDCSEIVCKACSKAHERRVPPHNVVPLQEIQQHSSSLLTLSKNCENHHDQKIMLYCCQHDKVICDSCVPISHRNCKSIISIEKAAKGVKDGTAISDLERRISDLCQITENIRSQSETTLEDLEKSRNKIKKRVTEIKQNAIAHLDSLEAEIHKDLESKYKTCTERVSQKRNNIQSSSDSMSKWKSDLKALKQGTSEIQLFEVIKYLDAKTYQKELEIRESQTATNPILKYHPSESESSIRNLVSDLGTITVQNIQVKIPLLEIDQQCQFLVRDKRKLALSHSFQTTKLENAGSINRGCFISDDRLLLSHNMKKQLFVCTLDGSNSNVIDLDDLPRYISVYDENFAVVSIGAAGIQIIDLTSLNPGRIIRVDGICRGITSLKGKIWVANKSFTLTIVDINGKVLKVIQTTFSPREICANQDGNVYCTDRNSAKVYVVTSDGKERVTYNSPDLTDPNGVAVDEHGDVYVAGHVSNNIHLKYNDGQKNEIALTADDGINGPSTLSFKNETKELLVVNNFNSSIYIYKTQ